MCRTRPPEGVDQRGWGLVAQQRRACLPVTGRAGACVSAMDRFAWTTGLLELGETLVVQQRGVRLYDGEEKVTGAVLRGAWQPGKAQRARAGAGEAARGKSVVVGLRQGDVKECDYG